MPRFGNRSKAELGNCHWVLRRIANKAIEYFDFTVMNGWRGPEEQNQLFERGLSKLQWPDSKHNRTDEEGLPESMAIDIAPWHSEAPHIRWERTEEFCYLAGFVMGIGTPVAEAAGFSLRWGRDWDMDHDLGDQTFNDYPHIELIPKD